MSGPKAEILFLDALTQKLTTQILNMQYNYFIYKVVFLLYSEFEQRFTLSPYKNVPHLFHTFNEITD